MYDTKKTEAAQQEQVQKGVQLSSSSCSMAEKETEVEVSVLSVQLFSSAQGNAESSKR